MKSFVILLIALFSGIGNCHAIIPDTVYIRKPESMGLIYKNLEVITNDGYKIETWFFPAQSPLSEGELRDLNGNRRTYETQDETKRPTIIVCNGDAGNMSYFQLYLAKSLDFPRVQCRHFRLARIRQKLTLCNGSQLPVLYGNAGRLPGCRTNHLRTGGGLERSDSRRRLVDRRLSVHDYGLHRRSGECVRRPFPSDRFRRFHPFGHEVQKQDPQ